MDYEFYKYSLNLCVLLGENLQGVFWQLLGDSMANLTYRGMTN